MARIRSIHPEACTSATLAKISAEAERTFWRLLTHCDDHGKCQDRPRVIWATLYPEHEHIGPVEVQRDLDQLAEVGLIVRYEVGGDRYIAVSSWSEFQHPQRARPSKYPDPPEPSATPPRSVRDTSATPPANARTGVEWSGDGGGGDARPKVPAHHDLLRPDAAPPLHQEVDDLVGVLVHVHGADAVDTAVGQLLDQRLRFPFPSNLRTALEAILGPSKPSVEDATAAAQRAVMDRNHLRAVGAVRCEACKDVGVVERDDGSFADCECKWKVSA